MELPPVLAEDVYDYGARSSGESHGVVLTKPHVVELILDLAGYDSHQDLTRTTFLEPSVGRGVFLVAAVRRLLASARKHRRKLGDLRKAALAFDVDAEHVEISRAAVRSALMAGGLTASQSEDLAAEWVVEGDYLLARVDRRFDFVCGNPPYIRIEQLAESLQFEYRRRFASLYDRADLYVAFIERSLDLLSRKGVLSFICADRWTLNRYGAPLRRKVASDFHVNCYVDLHGASPFESEVSAYPSIFVFGRRSSGAVQVGKLATASEAECAGLLAVMKDKMAKAPGVALASYPTWFEGEEPWVLSTPAHLSVLRKLEDRFSPLEADGKTQVRIGVATGADKLFIVHKDSDIEADRLVPLVMRDDIQNGKVKNSGRYVINTFGEDGKVVDLTRFPRLALYLESHADDIRKRHVSRKNPTSWFRTIDRVYPELVPIPKLLLPDIAGSNEVVLEEGHFHPHHNLYFVVSTAWDMEVLGGLLSSKVALFFVWSYAVKMRGGYLRFQAQYLRRIRVPNPIEIPIDLAGKIRVAFRRRDFKALDEHAMEAYGLETLPPFDFLDTRK